MLCEVWSLKVQAALCTQLQTKTTEVLAQEMKQQRQPKVLVISRPWAKKGTKCVFFFAVAPGISNWPCNCNNALSL